MPIYNQINDEGLCVGYSVLSGDVNDNLLILADSEASAADHVGMRWNGNEWEDVQGENTLSSVDLFAFREKFTPEEKVAIYTAAESNVQIRIWLDDLSALAQSGGRVYLDDPRTIAGVQYLETEGIIGSGRASQILSF